MGIRDKYQELKRAGKLSGTIAATIYTVRSVGGVGTVCGSVAEVVAAYNHYSQVTRDYSPVIMGGGIEYELYTDEDSGSQRMRAKENEWDAM